MSVKINCFDRWLSAVFQCNSTSSDNKDKVASMKMIVTTRLLGHLITIITLQNTTGRLFTCAVLLFSGLYPVPAAAQEALFSSRPQFRLNPEMHTAKIYRVDLDRREQFAVTASDDKSVLVWELDSGKMQKRLRLPAALGGAGKAYAVAISPDGEEIAVGAGQGGSEHFVYIYDRGSGDMVRTITGLKHVIQHLVYSPDGSFLAATLGRAGGLRIYRTENYHQVFSDETYDNISY